MTRAKVLDKVRKLLTLANGTEKIEEKDAANMRAGALIQKYQLHPAEFATPSPPRATPMPDSEKLRRARDIINRGYGFNEFAWRQSICLHTTRTALYDGHGNKLSETCTKCGKSL